jgi:Cytochrome P460
MKRIPFLLVAVATVVVVAFTAPASGHPDEDASPIYGVTIPAGYRDWKLIAVNHLLFAGKGDQLRAQLGNDIAIKAFKEGTLPFPDGSIIAAIHWTHVTSEDNNKVLDVPFPGTQSFVIGSPVNVQFMVKDSKKYAATGGWDSLTLRMANRATKRCTRPVSPATSLRKIATMSSPVMRLDAENQDRME